MLVTGQQQGYKKSWSNNAYKWETTRNV